MIELKSYIKHIPGHKDSKGDLAEWVIVSHDTGKIISSHKTKADAEKHLKQIQMFKHMKSVILTLLTKKANKDEDISIQIIDVEKDMFERLINEELLDEMKLMNLIKTKPELFKEIRKKVTQYLEKEISEEELYNYLKETVGKS